MRIRLTAPRGGAIRFRFLDSVHGAIVRAWCTAGARTDEVVGSTASTWSYGAVGTATGRDVIMTSLVVGAEGHRLTELLSRLQPSSVHKESSNGDTLDLSQWSMRSDPLPVIGDSDGIADLPVIMLSPLVISSKVERGKWETDLNALGDRLAPAVNARLSRLTDRAVNLTITPDRLYLRANPRHSTLVCTRAVPGRNPAYVLGTRCPMTLRGRVEDLALAWSLGIGEKNRYGFGCIGAAL